MDVNFQAIMGDPFYQPELTCGTGDMHESRCYIDARVQLDK